jgi:nucleotide-binding universal stress UspA family protein
MKTILVPTDFSKNADNALKYADEFAQLADGKLTLLNVYTPSAGRYNAISGILGDEVAIAGDTARKKLAALCKKAIQSRCISQFEVGIPVREIVAVAEKKKAGYIIMGTHGVSGLMSLIFGSTTASVISKSKVPVIAVPQSYKFKGIKTIVYATDLSNSWNELKYLLPLAKKWGAAIEIFYLDYGWDNAPEKISVLEKKIAAMAYKKVNLVVQKANLAVDMFEQISHFLDKRKPQLLVMFHQDKTAIQKFFGSSNTEDVSYGIKFPLLSVNKSLVKAG